MLEIKENELLSNHTTFHIGGPAKYFCSVSNLDELQEAIVWANNKNINYKVIGGGSNLLVSDNGYNGLIIKYFGNKLDIKQNKLIAIAGTSLSFAMNESLKVNLAGLEWAAGIPGTIGGAVYNNTGAYGGEISQVFFEADLLQENKIKILTAKDLNFGYRTSRLKEGKIKGVVLSVKLILQKVSDEDIIEINNKIKKILLDRYNKSSEGLSAGSTFKNIVLSKEKINKFREKFPQLPVEFVNNCTIPAAWLIDQCGLKGKKIGGAMVSEIHAGKITNIGGATAEDVIILISIIKQKVRNKFSLQLTEEIEFLGF